MEFFVCKYIRVLHIDFSVSNYIRKNPYVISVCNIINIIKYNKNHNNTKEFVCGSG